MTDDHEQQEKTGADPQTRLQIKYQRIPEELLSDFLGKHVSEVLNAVERNGAIPVGPPAPERPIH